MGADLENGAGPGLGDETDNLGHDTGAVYVFDRTGTTWTQRAYLKAPVRGRSDRFGERLSLSSGTLLIGAPGEDGSAAGVNGDPNDRNTLDSGAAFVRRIAP